VVEAAQTTKRPRDRSPSFPFISLRTAFERLESLEKKFGRHATPASKAGLAWGWKEKSGQGDQTLAALKSYGLVQYNGMGPARHVVLTDEGRNYLRAQQESVKADIRKKCALRPKVIQKFWTTWKTDRPADEVAIDELVLDERFSAPGARAFLKIYDDTISFAGLSSSDKIDIDLRDDDNGDGDDDQENGENGSHDPPLPPSPPRSPPLPPPPLSAPTGKVQVMVGERELTSGLLSKEASFRLIVRGAIGVKEIERLIKKLGFDKEILADQEDDETAN
jgi:hypothetical protein